MEAILWESGMCQYPVVGIEGKKVMLMCQIQE
jgi:hypothetical protein